MRKIILVVVAAFSAITKKINTGLVMGLLAAAVGVGVSAYTKGERVEKEASSLAMTTFYLKPGTPPTGINDPINWTSNPLVAPDGCDGGNQLCAIKVNPEDRVNNLPSEELLEEVETSWSSVDHEDPIVFEGRETIIYKKD